MLAQARHGRIGLAVLGFVVWIIGWHARARANEPPRIATRTAQAGGAPVPNPDLGVKTSGPPTVSASDAIVPPIVRVAPKPGKLSITIEPGTGKQPVPKKPVGKAKSTPAPADKPPGTAKAVAPPPSVAGRPEAAAKKAISSAPAKGAPKAAVPKAAVKRAGSAPPPAPAGLTCAAGLTYDRQQLKCIKPSAPQAAPRANAAPPAKPR